MSEATFLAATTWMLQAADGCQAWLSACTGWKQELARFADQRFSENSRTWSALMSSRDVAGAMMVQQQWAQQAATDYAQEAARLAQVLTSLSLTGATPDVRESAALVA